MEETNRGSSGINKITSFDTDDLNVKIAGQIPKADEDFGFDPDNHLEKKDQRKVDDFIIYAMAAAEIKPLRTLVGKHKLKRISTIRREFWLDLG